ncbi:MAG TPA: sulfotransferase [Solirubrobacterales bacterium]|nr:sulfotransferase [Solirubrobacterales bacterium]
MQENRLAWIFGSSRSGSTWLLKMLSDLEGVVPVDDPHLGHHLGVWRPIPLAWAACEEPPELNTLLDLKAEESGYFFAERYREAWWEPLRALIGARFEAQAEEAGVADPSAAAAFVVKEPGSHAAPLLTELFPESKVIFLLRDGRDVVDSWLDAYSDGSWAIPGGAFPVTAEGRVPLIKWLSAVWAYRSRAVRKAYEARPGGARILIRYEDLRAETETWLRRVCELIGIETAAVPDVVERHRFEKLPSAARGRRSFTRKAQPGGWRENLTPAEQRAMHEAMGDALAEFGYEVDEQLAATG